MAQWSIASVVSLSNFSTLAVAVSIVLPDTDQRALAIYSHAQDAFEDLDVRLVHIEAVQPALGDHHRCVLHYQGQVVVLLDLRDFEDVRAAQQLHARIDQPVGQHFEAGIVADAQDGAQSQQYFRASLFGAQDRTLFNFGQLGFRLLDFLIAHHHVADDVGNHAGLGGYHGSARERGNARRARGATRTEMRSQTGFITTSLILHL